MVSDADKLQDDGRRRRGAAPDDRSSDGRRKPDARNARREAPGDSKDGQASASKPGEGVATVAAASLEEPKGAPRGSDADHRTDSHEVAGGDFAEEQPTCADDETDRPADGGASLEEAEHTPPGGDAGRGDAAAADGPAEEQLTRTDDETGQPVTPVEGHGASLVAVLLAGAAAALVIVGALYFLGLLRFEATGDLAALRNTVESAATRLSTLEERLSARGSGSDDQVTDGALSALQDRLAGVEQRLDATGSNEAPDLSAIESRLAELESGIGSLRESAGDAGQLNRHLDPLKTQVSDLASTVETLSGRIDSALGNRDPETERALARAAATAVALSGLSRQVDNGRAYGDELAALRPLVSKDADLDALAAHADSGLPTSEQLAHQFGEASDAILTAGSQDAESGGIVARLASSARSLVRIRPAGPVEGDSRAAIVSRIDAALRAGDLETARAEWQALDDDARTAAGDWGEVLQARLDAEAEIAKLSTAASAALDAPSARE